MGFKEDIQENLRDKPVTKIHGQPNHTNIARLSKELAKIAAGVPTSLGGGKHGHIGLIY